MCVPLMFLFPCCFLMQVVHEIVSSKSIMEWLENYALEQLSDLSCNLFDLLIRCSKLVHETLPLVVLVLKIIISALEISQKRKMYQPHFTPSMWSLYQLYQAVHRCDNMKSSLCAELGLKAILMSVPPITILQMVYLSFSFCMQSFFFAFFPLGGGFGGGNGWWRGCMCGCEITGGFCVCVHVCIFYFDITVSPFCMV